MAAANSRERAAVEDFTVTGMLLGQQVGGIGTGFGIGLDSGRYLSDRTGIYPLGDYGFFSCRHCCDRVCF
jgi:hypothetical protein